MNIITQKGTAPGVRCLLGVALPGAHNPYRLPRAFPRQQSHPGELAPIPCICRASRTMSMKRKPLENVII